MCSMSVLCPLCAQTSFSSIDALRCSLIKAANGPLACPICHELFLGLDKLTIHLFSHTNIMNSANNTTNATNTPPPPAPPSSSSPSSTTADSENMKNIEKLKTQNENEMNLKQENNNSSNCNETKIKQNHLKDELVSFDETHHNLNEKNMIKKPKVVSKTDKKIVNKSFITQQHQQVVLNKRNEGKEVEVEEEVEESKELDNLAQCDICEFTFRNEELRNMHIRLVHQNIECHSQLNSTLTASSSSLNNCQNSCQEHDFKCHLCAKTFKMKGSLRVHLKVVHLMGLPYVNNSPKLTICDRIRHKENKTLKTSNICNTNSQLQNDNVNTISSTNNNFKNINNNNNNNNNALFNIQPVNFISNLNSLPVSSNVSVVNLNQSLDFPSNNLDNSIVQAPNVLLVFNSSASAEMSQNLNSISSNVNNNNNNVTTTTLMPLTTPTDKEISAKITSAMINVTENPKIWECDVCSKAFTTKYFLKKHKRLHTGEMPYTCELCARTFTFQQSYHKHLLYHSDEKPHVCSTCGRAFKELSTLHNHERIHSGEKPFKCDVCGKSFRQRVSFLVHTRIHTGVMPYKCEICQKSFRYKVSQRTHKCQPFSTEESSPPPNEENTIDHMSENFIKAFLETSVANQTDNQNHLNQSHNSPASNEIAAINEKATSLNEQQALLTKTIDDIVVESCNKMGIGGVNGFSPQQILNDGSMSPSQRLQNMRLYSPQLVTPDLNVIEGDLTRFFMENSQSSNNLL
ncbi:zinc finger protein 107 [Lucilia cuprina]|uniref:zinc finger protein 107 n=1 Tax=Lucilia cuprina TaxID=7375 RepID=UPI001F0530A7|nr:zinc finger protein 107 [Lucilia cuprina]